MIQFNLLPDVKLEYIRAQRMKRLTMACAFIVTASAVALLVILFTIGQLQKKHISDLSDDITAQTKELQGQNQIGKVLTVQNQLQSLTGLHDQRPATSRAFLYFSQLPPESVNIGGITVKMTDQKTIQVSGTADKLSSVNKFVDTLKYTTYKTEPTADSLPAFKDVVLTSFGLVADAKDGNPASYTIDMTYEAAIFDVTLNPVLSVPSKTTTGVVSDQSSTEGGN